MHKKFSIKINLCRNRVLMFLTTPMCLAMFAGEEHRQRRKYSNHFADVGNMVSFNLLHIVIWYKSATQRPFHSSNAVWFISILLCLILIVGFFLRRNDRERLSNEAN